MHSDSEEDVPSRRRASGRYAVTSNEPSARRPSRSTTPRPAPPSGSPSHSVVQVQRYLAPSQGEEDVPATLLDRYGVPPHADYAHQNVFWPAAAAASDNAPRTTPAVMRTPAPPALWIQPNTRRQVQRYPRTSGPGEEDFPASFIERHGPPPHDGYGHENVFHRDGASRPGSSFQQRHGHAHRNDEPARAPDDAAELSAADAQRLGLLAPASPHSERSTPRALPDGHGDVSMNALGRRAERRYERGSAVRRGW